ncbi:MAG: energy-coupling factor ABC transporter ATP-binding protein [Kiritimatiellae bacterium]|nr:energy-coupling factor ABC transporter ATP-binding protein [Kiritimatiellia bacterium]
MSTPAIEVKNLRYAYPDGTQALRDVSFAIQQGEAVGLVGANGAGKSTLLLHLTGSLRPAQGEIWIMGEQLLPKTKKAVRSRVGLVFQDPDDQLFMPTVEEDVAFGPLHGGCSSEEVERRVAVALEKVGMTRQRARPPYRLSAGEKRAVAIATVLSMSPDALLMDEPSTHLDPRSRRRLIEWLRSYSKARVIATHDLELVVEVCSRVIVLSDGEIVADGPTQTVLNDEPLMLAHGLERPHILLHHHPHDH